ncbi:uncharacterized mitochondrial protein AtMg00810-like [Vicia villosa]|uniref:uncharacterized mitochondrial protein AtMg00810-like n=1 Tax=Vicia villosa TaxID=3911 RepID=UPI00273B3389|nr:uncharacterized mitochondrial protein AtMg00810-like [Vicia villosa]
MSMVGELTYFLGLQIKQMEDSTFLSQSKYAKNIVKKFGMDNASHKRTPAPTHLKLSKDEGGISVDQSLYRSVIGSLLYLKASRPDIAFAVGTCARYQAEPKVSHLNQVKRIFKYVNGTSDYGILYTHGCDPILTGYCYADWAGSANDRKSTSGGYFFLGNNLISWLSKKQNCVSLSTTEAEYIAAGSSCSQLNVMTLYCDNLSAINISKNPIQHSRTKHIDIRHHFIRELVKDKVICLEHVSTELQLAGIFTKAIDATQFENLRSKTSPSSLENDGGLSFSRNGDGRQRSTVESSPIKFLSSHLSSSTFSVSPSQLLSLQLIVLVSLQTAPEKELTQRCFFRLKIDPVKEIA